MNDGKTGAVIPENRLNLGCNAGTREAAALGVRLSDRWSLSRRSSISARRAVRPDRPRGPANFGARLGYTFDRLRYACHAEDRFRCRRAAL